VANVSSSDRDWGGHLTEDRLELYFASDRSPAGDLDLFVARRASTLEPFGAPMRPDDLSTAGVEDDPFVDADGLTLWFGRDGTIMISTRASTSDPWGPATVVPVVTDAGNTFAPALSPDGLSLYLSSDRPGGVGDRDLWHARRASIADAFGTPVHLGAANTPDFDCCAFVANGGGELWFSSDGLSGSNEEIVVVTRDPATGLTIGAPSVNTLFDSSASELDVFGTRDGEVIGFSSNRPGGAGSFDLFLMERSCP